MKMGCVVCNLSAVQYQACSLGFCTVREKHSILGDSDRCSWAPALRLPSLQSLPSAAIFAITVQSAEISRPRPGLPTRPRLSRRKPLRFPLAYP